MFHKRYSIRIRATQHEDQEHNKLHLALRLFSNALQITQCLALLYLSYHWKNTYPLKLDTEGRMVGHSAPAQRTQDRQNTKIHFNQVVTFNVSFLYVLTVICYLGPSLQKKYNISEALDV